MHDFMSYVGGKTNRVLAEHDTTWQDGYYDTHVKTRKQFEYVAYYIEQNPVAKTLANSPEQWDASSASCNDTVTLPWPPIYD